MVAAQAEQSAGCDVDGLAAASSWIHGWDLREIESDTWAWDRSFPAAGLPDSGGWRAAPGGQMDFCPGPLAAFSLTTNEAGGTR